MPHNHDTSPDYALELYLPHLSDAEFFAICQENREWRMERNSDKTIRSLPPTGFETGKRNAELVAELILWNRKSKTGVVGESSTGFTLPNDAIRSPDASWISHERLRQTTAADRERFVHAVPEFVVEIRSATDSLGRLMAKMDEYVTNGVLLGWLIDLERQAVHVYRAGKSVEVMTGFEQTLSGEEVLPGFLFDLKWIR
ncbi:MAG: Uma2 family endonuclease [Saprospiraceae bacterium]|nr:Uma2 family endonuclease [Saprospiraceae bacterium]